MALFFLLWIIQRHFISIEGRRIRTKAPTLNKKKRLRDNEDLKEKKKTDKKTSNLPKAQENASDQVPINFSFDCDWLRRWRDIFRAITERSVNSWLLWLLLYRNFIKRARKKKKGQLRFLKGCNRGIQQKITDLVDYCNFIETEFTSGMVKFTEETDRPADPRHTSRVKCENNKQSLTLRDNLSQPFLHILT